MKNGPCEPPSGSRVDVWCRQVGDVVTSGGHDPPPSDCLLPFKRRTPPHTLLSVFQHILPSETVNLVKSPLPDSKEGFFSPPLELF